LTLNRFFIKDSNIHSSYILPDGDEHHHLSKVARIKPIKQFGSLMQTASTIWPELKKSEKTIRGSK